MLDKILIANRGDRPQAAQRRSQIAWRAQHTGAVLPRETAVFDKILIANRGDQPQSGAATTSNRPACVARPGGFAAGDGRV